MFYVSFEGIDGSGKTTIMEMVYRYYTDKFVSLLMDRKVIRTKEPTGILRELILDPDNKIGLTEMARFFLYQADRACHTQKVLVPNLLTPNMILCDRGMVSTLVYQSETTKLTYEKLYEISLIACQNILPHVVVMLECDYESSRKRIDGRDEKKNHFDLKGEEFFKNLIWGYNKAQAYLEMYSDIEFINIKTDNKSIDEVFNEVVIALNNK
jgi:dTMP kinase